MQVFNNPPKKDWPSLCQRPQAQLEFLESIVRNIMMRVKNSGDQALRELTLQLDKVTIAELQVTETEIDEAENLLTEKLKSAIRIATDNIETFPRFTKKRSYQN